MRDLRGSNATLQIVDRHTGGWGHINVDHILLSDAPARSSDPPPALWADYGADFYAGVTWSDIPGKDGRCLWLGWMSNWQYAGDLPTTTWRGQMSIPRELLLRRTRDGLRLLQRPVRELEKLRGKRHRLRRASVSEASEWLGKRQFKSHRLEIEATFEVDETPGDLAFVITTGDNERTIISRTTTGRFSIDRTQSGKSDFHAAFPARHHATLIDQGGILRLRLFLDASSLEVFGNEGEVVLTDLIFPTSARCALSMTSSDDSIRVWDLKVWELKSAWR